MASLPVTSFQIRMSNISGGFVRINTRGDGPFDIGPLDFVAITAFATLLNLPNPEYDPVDSTLRCGGRKQFPNSPFV